MYAPKLAKEVLRSFRPRYPARFAPAAGPTVYPPSALSSLPRRSSAGPAQSQISASRQKAEQTSSRFYEALLHFAVKQIGPLSHPDVSASGIVIPPRREKVDIELQSVRADP